MQSLKGNGLSSIGVISLNNCEYWLCHAHVWTSTNSLLGRKNFDKISSPEPVSLETNTHLVNCLHRCFKPVGLGANLFLFSHKEVMNLSAIPENYFFK